MSHFFRGESHMCLTTKDLEVDLTLVLMDTFILRMT